MKHILCFGDSNTYGLIPKEGGRYPWGIRWTNDCKTIYGATADSIGKGISRIVRQIRINAGQSKILLISPIHLGADVWKNEYDPDFSDLSVAISKELSDVYQKVCENENIYFLDASSYADSSNADQEHLDEGGHRLLADAILKKISEIEENQEVKSHISMVIYRE